MGKSVERVAADEPLATAIARAFERLRSDDAMSCSLMFDVGWVPTTDLVEILAKEVAETESLRTLVLIHPSAAMSFIATAVQAKCGAVKVEARRSVYDDGENEDGTDATASKTMYVMEPHERHDVFVRRAVAEARRRVDRKFALLFTGATPLPRDIADVLFEELLHSGAKEVGLIYRGEGLDVVAASLRLRLPNVVIALAGERPAAGKPTSTR